MMKTETIMKEPKEKQTRSGIGLDDPICSAVLDWYRGPAQGGGGTAGGEYWNDGDTLLIVIELRGGASEVVCVNVYADEGCADMTLQSTGDDTGWQLSDISWWAIINDKFPKLTDTDSYVYVCESCRKECDSESWENIAARLRGISPRCTCGNETPVWRKVLKQND